MSEFKKLLIVECFDKIEAFNDISGFLNKPVDPLLEYNMLLEELNEYRSAIHEGDEAGVKDALADMMVVLYGTALKHGLTEAQFWKVLETVCDANLTKFCRTEEEATQTIQKYQEQGITALPYYNRKHGVWVIKRNDGKTLKSINFAAPVHQ